MTVFDGIRHGIAAASLAICYGRTKPADLKTGQRITFILFCGCFDVGVSFITLFDFASGLIEIHVSYGRSSRPILLKEEFQTRVCVNGDLIPCF